MYAIDQEIVNRFNKSWNNILKGIQNGTIPVDKSLNQEIQKQKEIEKQKEAADQLKTQAAPISDNLIIAGLVGVALLVKKKKKR